MPERTILVVDDDPIALKVFQLSLERVGFAVEKATSAKKAIELLRARGPAAFLAILTDYQLPGMSGLELLEWARGLDNALSVVIVTSQSERALIHASMKQGASDFLEKPVSPNLLVETINTACEKTIKNRQLNTTQKNVRAVAQMNHFFKSVLVPAIVPYIQLHYTPHDEVGGDFVNVLPLDAGRFLMLVGDVSGHDLRAGFVSAYFQGLVRGLCHQGHGILQSCIAFNDILTHEWERRDLSQNAFKLEPRTTLSLLAVEIDKAANRAVVVNCGAPALRVAHLDGTCESVEISNMPLGWVHDDSIKSTVVDLKEVAFMYLATDGLHDWAEKMGSSSLGLAYRLLQERKPPGGTPPDDLLVFRYQHAQNVSSEELWHPLAQALAEGLEPEETAAKLAGALKNTLPTAPGKDVLLAALRSYEKPIKRACVSLRPKDGALKMVTRFEDNSTTEVTL